MMRGIRGAICAEANTREAVFGATRTLLTTMIERNEIDIERIASIFLTATPDLTAEFPAYAVRDIGLSMVPLLCASEINVPGAMKSVIRILIHVDIDKSQAQIKHCYLGEAARLRPDLAGGVK